MEMTTYDMERQAAMPMAAPVGAVTPGYRLVAPTQLQVHGTFAPIFMGTMGISAKPWTARSDRQAGAFAGGAMNGRSARRLGRSST